MQLTQIDQKNVFTEYTFKQTYLINRQNSVNYGISLFPDKEISNNHCTVHCLDDMGFFLQDLGSSNSTFIKLTEKSNVKLEEGLQILMGESIFEITKLASKRIKLHVITDYSSENPKMCDIEIKCSDSDEVPFGRNFGAENKLCFNKDKEIDEEHAIFKKFKNYFVFSPLKTVNRLPLFRFFY